MPCEYRPMRPDDYHEIYALWQRVCMGALDDVDSEKNIHSYLAKSPGQSFVCCADGAIVGTILCANDGRRAYIHHMAVLPDHRRSGVASELARRALAVQKSLGINKCNLFVFRRNELGRTFWESQGFSVRDDLDIMSREI